MFYEHPNGKPKGTGLLELIKHPCVMKVNCVCENVYMNIDMARETNARMMHRFNCKHFHYENCMKKSGWYGSFHILMECEASAEE